MVKFSIDTGSPEAVDALAELGLQHPSAAKPRRIVSAVFLCVAAVLLLLFIRSFIIYGILKVFYLASTVIILGIAIILKPFQRFILKKNIRSSTPELVAEYTADEDGIHIHHSLGDADVKWSAFTHTGEQGSFFYMEMKTHQFVLCDRKKVSQEELQTLQTLAHTHISGN